MKIEDQVCTLEQSKILRQLGIKNDAYFFWHFGIYNWIIIDREHSHTDDTEDYPAFTVSEFGKMIGSGTGASQSFWEWLSGCVNSGLSATVCYNAVALAGYVITQLQIDILDAEDANKRLKYNIEKQIIIKRAWSSSGKKTITFSSDLMDNQKWGEFKKLLVEKLGKNWGFDTATTLKIPKDIAHFTDDSFNP